MPDALEERELTKYEFCIPAQKLLSLQEAAQSRSPLDTFLFQAVKQPADLRLRVCGAERAKARLED